MAWNSVNVVLIWKLAKKFIKSDLVVTLTTFLFLIFSTIPLTEGNIANAEVFMIMPVTAAVLILFNLTEKKEKGITGILKSWLVKHDWRYLLIGVLMAVGFLFKVPVGFELFGLLVWLVVYKAESVIDFLKRVFDQRVRLIIFGFLAPVVLSIIYYFLAGAGESYVRSALGQNIGYLSSWEGESRPFYQSGLFVRGMIMMGSMTGIWLLRKKLGNKYGLISLWFVGALFGSQLAGRPYPHYFIEIVPAGALLLGMMIDSLKTKKKEFLKDWGKVIVGLGLFGLVIWSMLAYKFWYYKSWPYYKNFVGYVLGDKNRDEYMSFWGSGVLRNYEVAKYIREITEEDEQIFVWGTEPAIYVLSNRLPVGKYTVAYHILDFGAKEETIKRLIEEKPRVIVKMTSEGHVFSELEGLLADKYLMVKQFNEAVVYLFKNGW